MQIDMWLTHLFTQAEYEMYVGAVTAFGAFYGFWVEVSSGLLEKQAILISKLLDLSLMLSNSTGFCYCGCHR